MCNWSVDEKKFKNYKEILKFLKQIPEVITVKIIKRKDKWNNTVIKTKLLPNIHPARKTFIAHYLQAQMDILQISIIESK